MGHFNHHQTLSLYCRCLKRGCLQGSMSARNLTALGLSVGIGVVTGRCNRQDRQTGHTEC